MEMRQGIALDSIDFKLFVKMKLIEGFENPKNWFGVSIENTRVKTKTKDFFWNHELNYINFHTQH